MLSIRCSALEQVRNSPALFAQSLLENAKGSPASFGMFGCWQSAIRAMHIEDKTISETITALQNNFLRFNETSANKAKQEKLIRNLVAYEKEFSKYKFEFEEGIHRIKWELHRQVRLTGNTPWVVKNSTGFFSFFPIEMEIPWLTQLKFPLLQKYIAEEILRCDASNLSMGVYRLNENKFDFKCFDSVEIGEAVKEIKDLFQNVYNEYSARK